MVIDRYLISQIARPMAMGVGLLVVIFFGYSASRQLAQAAERAIDLTVAIELIALNTLTSLDILLPSALFFSILAGLGRLYKDAEIPVLLATGISAWRLLWAVTKLALIVAALVGLMAIVVRPWLYSKIYHLESQAERQLDAGQMPTGGFVHLDALQYVFIADSLDESTGSYNNVFLYKQHVPGKRSEIIHARSAKLPSLQLQGSREVVFSDNFQYVLHLDGTRDVSIKTGEYAILLAAMEARKEKFRRKAADTALLSQSKELKDIGEYQWRMSSPFITVLLALIAVPLSRVWPRESRTRNVALAIFIYIVVLSFTTAVRSWMEQGVVPPMPGMWAAYVVPLVILALLLTNKRWKNQ